MKYKINDEGLEEGKFPSSTGKPVLIENKASILKTIDDNIIDKDVAMMILGRDGRYGCSLIFCNIP